MSADESKQAGNAALAAKDYAAAIQHFTKAIEIDPDHHVYYSNRSAAHLHAGDAAAALADAEAAIRAKPDWPRGHSRKGAALWKQGDLNAAAMAFEKGLEHGPNDALKGMLKDVKAAIARRAAASAAAASSSASAAAPAPASLKTLLFGGVGAAVQLVLFAVRVFLLLHVALYANPLASASAAAGAYRNVFLGAIVTHAALLAWNTGRPRLNMTYGMSVVMEPAAAALCYDCMCLFQSARPFVLLVVPVLVAESVYALKYAHAVATAVSPALGSALFAPANALLPPLLGIGGVGSWPAHASAGGAASRISFMVRNVPRWRAHTEVAAGLGLLLSVVTPYRDLLAFIIYWQYLRVGYMLPMHVPAGFGLSTDSNIKRSFHALDKGICSALARPYVPGAIGSVYALVKKPLAWMAQLPAGAGADTDGAAPGTGARAGGAASRCNIM